MKKKRKWLLLCLGVMFVILLFIFKENIASALSSIIKSFQRTLIEENRYKLVFIGLKSTLLISLTSIILGATFGIIICYFRKSPYNSIKNIAKIIVNLLQGTPITVLLLIFYYVIFGNVNIEPIIVAITTFSIYFSAYCSEIYRGAIDSINKVQIESAYSLGFTKIQSIRYVILPQMLSYIIPVFKNECVSLIKLTSIAGYISIMDLTKASDIIRNRTYEAFFPLIFTAIVYLIICYLVGKLLDMLYKKINPRKALKTR